ncbi:MAG: PP2C family protein-serine/threonine phosphatase [Bacillota bacterium]
MNSIIYNFIIFFILLLLYFKYRKENQELKSKVKSQTEEIEELKKDVKGKLKKAQDVHRKMLPKELAEPNNFLISDYYQPAEYIGGDYYNIFSIDHGSMNAFFDQYLIYYFDVSGHGIDSTLLSIFINDSIENYFKLRHNPGELVSTKEIMDYIDEQYQNEEFPDDYLVCLYIGVLDREKAELSYTSRGFQFPIYKINNNQNIERIDTGGLPISTAIGKMEEASSEKKIKVEKNSTFLFSTDGLLEQVNGEKSYYENIENILEKYKFLPAPYLRDMIQKDFYDFTNNKPGEDDITYIVLDHQDKIKKWNLNKKDNDLQIVYEKLKKEIKNERDFLAKKVYKDFNKIISDLFLKHSEELLANKMKIKFLNNKSVLMLGFEVRSNNFSWDEILNNYTEIVLIKYMNIFKDGEISFSEDNVYFSCNKDKNRIYLAIFKK